MPLKTRINERVAERNSAIHPVFPRKFLRKISEKDATESTNNERVSTIKPNVRYTGVETGKNWFATTNGAAIEIAEKIELATKNQKSAHPILNARSARIRKTRA